MPTPDGVRFDTLERELWRALDDWEADLCPGCGQPLTETTKKLEPGEASRYTVDVRFCQVCRELEVKASDMMESNEKRSKAAGRRLPSGHWRFSVRTEPLHQH